jgi:serine carboxypeptidase-like clade 2
MIRQATYEGLKQHCNMSAVVLWRTDGESGVDGECATFRDAALKEMGGYDQYGMSAPKCLLGADGQPLREQPRATEIPSATFDPCAPQRLKAYFNRADVQEALHVIKRGQEALPWTACNSRGITYSYDSLATSMLPVHRKLLDAGLRALVFSGDQDGVVPTRSSRSWVESLDLLAAGDFRPWVDTATNETAGYVTPYQGLTLAAVHGAGHHVSYFKPRQALQMISAWLDGGLP